MTHVAWRQSGLPPTHVIGAGCNLDSERLSHVMDINLNTHKPAWVIGELSDNKSEPERKDWLFKYLLVFFFFLQWVPDLYTDGFSIYRYVLTHLFTSRVFPPTISTISSNAALPVQLVLSFYSKDLEKNTSHPNNYVSVFVSQLLWWVTLGWTPVHHLRLPKDPALPNHC